MVNNEDNFEDEGEYSLGYDKVTIDGTLDTRHINVFKKGVKRISDVYDYYLNERRTRFGNPDKCLLDETLELHELNYIFYNVETGETPLNRLEYMAQKIINDEIIQRLGKVDRLSLSGLLDIVNSFEEI